MHSFLVISITIENFWSWTPSSYVCFNVLWLQKLCNAYILKNIIRFYVAYPSNCSLFNQRQNLMFVFDCLQLNMFNVRSMFIHYTFIVRETFSEHLIYTKHAFQVEIQHFCNFWKILLQWLCYELPMKLCKLSWIIFSIHCLRIEQQ